MTFDRTTADQQGPQRRQAGAPRSRGTPALDGRAPDATPALAADEALSAERVSEMRRRIRRGAYDSPEIIDTVARRLLDSGDL